jgi:DNA-binding MurR/RpiR family transcriptional regulator
MSSVAHPPIGEVEPARAKLADRAALGYSRPRSYEEFRAVLSSGTTRLPKKMRQVAIFLWQQPTVVALGTVTSIAQQAEVQPSTLVRFAQSFGYSGFSDLQDLFKTHLSGGGRGVRDQQEADGGAAGSEPARLVDGFVGSSMSSLARVRDRLDPQSFDRIASELAGAELIYVVGSKRAFSLASFASLAMSNLGIRNICVDNVGSVAFEQLRCGTPQDVVLAISFTPYNSVTPELAASAAQRGVPIVSITDSAFSPLAPISRAYVEVVEEEFAGFKSLSATLAVAMALVLRVAGLRGALGSADPSRAAARAGNSKTKTRPRG